MNRRSFICRIGGAILGVVASVYFPSWADGMPATNRPPSVATPESVKLVGGWLDGRTIPTTSVVKRLSFPVSTAPISMDTTPSFEFEQYERTGGYEDGAPVFALSN